MATVQVKICGVRTGDGAAACAQAGVDFAGFNFVDGARRAIDPTTARRLIPALGAVQPVGVFRDATPAEVRAVADDLGLGWVQLHGNESPQQCALLAETYRVIKALAASHAGDAGKLRAYASAATILLVDGPTPGGGEAWPWALLEAYKGAFEGVPIFVAGGLRPDNVASAVQAARPAGVDTASGVEEHGRLAPAKVLAFCEAARRAAGGGVR
jgi:phosphoribosylanthranilate isomerase